MNPTTAARIVRTELIELFSRKPTTWLEADPVYREELSAAIDSLPVIEADTLGDRPCDDFEEVPHSTVFTVFINGAWYLVDTQGYSYARYVLKLVDDTTTTNAKRQPWQPTKTTKKKHWVVFLDSTDDEVVVHTTSQHKAMKAAQQHFNANDWNEVSLDELYAVEIDCIEAE